MLERHNPIRLGPTIVTSFKFNLHHHRGFYLQIQPLFLFINLAKGHLDATPNNAWKILLI